MLVITGIFEDGRFIPDEPVSIPQKKKVKVIVDEGTAKDMEITEKLAKLEYINNNLKELNETDPLPLEFNEILSQRLNFKGVLETLVFLFLIQTWYHSTFARTLKLSKKYMARYLPMTKC